MEVPHDKVPPAVLQLMTLNAEAFLPRQQEHQERLRRRLEKLREEVEAEKALQKSAADQ